MAYFFLLVAAIALALVLRRRHNRAKAKEAARQPALPLSFQARTTTLELRPEGQAGTAKLTELNYNQRRARTQPRGPGGKFAAPATISGTVARSGTVAARRDIDDYIPAYIAPSYYASVPVEEPHVTSHGDCSASVTPDFSTSPSDSFCGGGGDFGGGGATGSFD